MVFFLVSFGFRVGVTAKVQSGSNVCSVDRGGCAHLCLPVSATERVCKCAAGYRADAADARRCVSADSFLLYSLNWEIKGFRLPGAAAPPHFLFHFSRLFPVQSFTASFSPKFHLVSTSLT